MSKLKILAHPNPQKMHYEVSNNYNDIHTSQNLCGRIQVTMFRYLWKAVGIVALICYPPYFSCVTITNTRILSSVLTTPPRFRTVATMAIAHFACHGTQDQSNPLSSSQIRGWMVKCLPNHERKNTEWSTGFFVCVRDGSGCRKAPGWRDELGGIFTLCWIWSYYCYNVVSFAFVDYQLSFPVQCLIWIFW